MTDSWVNRFVFDEAGCGFFDDGVYYVDYGCYIHLAEWDETLWEGPQ